MTHQFFLSFMSAHERGNVKRHLTRAVSKSKLDFLTSEPHNLRHLTITLPDLQPNGILTPAFFATASIKSPCSHSTTLFEGSNVTVTGFP